MGTYEIKTRINRLCKTLYPITEMCARHVAEMKFKRIRRTERILTEIKNMEEIEQIMYLKQMEDAISKEAV